MIDRIAGHTFLTAPLTRRAVVIDLGVNKAEFSLQLASRYGSRIVGVEPVPTLYDALPVVPRGSFDPAAITGDGEPVTLHLNPAICATIVDTLRRDDAEAITVEGVTLQELMDRHGVANAALVKADIEGAELPMLEAVDHRTLERVDQLSVEFHDFLDPAQRPSVDRCKQRLRDLGFACVTFSRDNSDVLFVNRQRVSFSSLRRLWVHVRYKHPRGLVRVARRVSTRAS